MGRQSGVVVTNNLILCANVCLGSVNNLLYNYHYIEHYIASNKVLGVSIVVLLTAAYRFLFSRT